jgi:hypothetical protein
MDWVSLWKAASIVLTGAFGVLGLLKDYKDRATGRITVAGRISLAGILLSSTFGLLVQLKERSDQERARAETARQTLVLAQNTAKTVKDLQRMLSPLEEPKLNLVFKLACDGSFKEVCEHRRQAPASSDYWNWWPQDWRSLDGDANVFADPQDAARFVRGQLDHGDLSMHVQSSVGPAHLLVTDETGKTATFYWSAENGGFSNNGRLASMLDLPRSTIIFTFPASRELLDSMQLSDFVLRAKNGQSKHASGPFEKISIPMKFLNIATTTPGVRYVFPEEQ